MILNITERRYKFIEIMFDDYLCSCFRRENELNKIMFIDEEFNNLINHLMISSKSLIILRKKGLLMI